MIMTTSHPITPLLRQGEALGLRLMTSNGYSVLMSTLFGAVGTVAAAMALFSQVVFNCAQRQTVNRQLRFWAIRRVHLIGRDQPA